MKGLRQTKQPRCSQYFLWLVNSNRLRAWLSCLVGLQIVLDNGTQKNAKNWFCAAFTLMYARGSSAKSELDQRRGPFASWFWTLPICIHWAAVQTLSTVAWHWVPKTIPLEWRKCLLRTSNNMSLMSPYTSVLWSSLARWFRLIFATAWCKEADGNHRQEPSTILEDSQEEQPQDEARASLWNGGSWAIGNWWEIVDVVEPAVFQQTSPAHGKPDGVWLRISNDSPQSRGEESVLPQRSS